MLSSSQIISTISNGSAGKMQVGDPDLDFSTSSDLVSVDDWRGTVFRMAILIDQLNV